MSSSVYFPELLEPLALTLIDQALQRQRDLSDSTVTDDIAEQLYRRHRSERARSVQERTWAALPNSEKGKYRKIVKLAKEDREV